MKSYGKPILKGKDSDLARNDISTFVTKSEHTSVTYTESFAKQEVIKGKSKPKTMHAAHNLDPEATLKKGSHLIIKSM